MNSQIGHAQVVGVGVDEGEGDSASPVFDDGTCFAGEAIFSFCEFMLSH